MVLQRRYRCTGDVVRLDEAMELMGRPLRLWSDSVIALENAAGLALYRAHVRELGRWVQPRFLHLTADDARMLIGFLPGRPVRERLKADPDYRRALELVARHQTAAPRIPDPWNRELGLRRRLGDHAGLTELARRVRAAGRFNIEPARDSFERSSSAEVKTAQQARTDQLRAFLATPPAGTDPKTRAVARILRAFLEPRPDVSELRRARAEWPDLVRESSIGWALFDSMVFDATKGDPQREKILRDLGTYLGARELDLKERDRPESAEVRKLLADEDLSLELWVVGQLLGDQAMEQKAAATFKDEWDRLVVEIRWRLFQGWPSVDAAAALYGFSQPERAR